MLAELGLEAKAAEQAAAEAPAAAASSKAAKRKAKKAAGGQQAAPANGSSENKVSKGEGRGTTRRRRGGAGARRVWAPARCRRCNACELREASDCCLLCSVDLTGRIKPALSRSFGSGQRLGPERRWSRLVLA